MSAFRRRPTRATLPIRFAAPKLEQLEDRLPPGDLLSLLANALPTPFAAPASPLPPNSLSKATLLSPQQLASPVVASPLPIVPLPSIPVTNSQTVTPATATPATPASDFGSSNFSVMNHALASPASSKPIDPGTATAASGSAVLGFSMGSTTSGAGAASAPAAVAPTASGSGTGPSASAAGLAPGIPGQGGTTAPGTGGTAPITIASISEDTGVSASDFITRDNTLTVRGTGSSGTPVSVLVDGQAAATATVNASGQWSAQVPALSDGRHQIEARRQGSTQPGQSIYATIITSPPTLQIIGHPYVVTSDPIVQVEARNADGSIPRSIPLTLDIDWNNDGNFSGANELGVASAVSTGAQATPIQLHDMPEGNWNLRVRTEDVAGNVGVSSKFLLHVATDLDGMLDPRLGHAGESGANGVAHPAAPAHGTGSGESLYYEGYNVVNNLATSMAGQSAGSGSINVAGAGGVAGDAPVPPAGNSQPPTSNSGSILLSTFNEVEPNDTQGTGNGVNVTPGDPLVISGGIGTTTDEDWFTFTLSARAGVFFDIDSRETGLSTTLDTDLAVFDSGGTQLDINDNGYDFDTGFPGQGATPSGSSADSALYRELGAGTYAVRVRGASSSMGNYTLTINADTTFLTSVPVFASNPGAAVTLFLDFDGHSATDSWNNGNAYSASAYDFNGNAGEFSPGEVKAIESAFRTLAEDYAPFNVNVTTSYSGTFDDGIAMRVVVTNNDASVVGVSSPGGVLGIAFLGSFAGGGANDQVCWVFNPIFNSYFTNGTSDRIMQGGAGIGTVAAHEAGHTFGLAHFGGNTPVTTAIMNTFYPGIGRQTWNTGSTADTEPPVVTQDDMAVISNTTNAFGYRPDDHGNTTATATVLTATGSVYSGSGIIAEIATDIDLFQFTATSGGPTTISVQVDDFLNDLDLQIALLDASGAVVATDNSGTSFDGLISMPLADGTYYLQVQSNGTVGSAGQYLFTIGLPTPPPPPGGGGGGGGGTTINFNGDSFEPNDTSDVATDLGTITGATLSNLNINIKENGLSDYDWFKFTAQQDGTYTVSIPVTMAGPLEMHLWTESGGYLTEVASGSSAAAAFAAGQVVYVEIKGVSTGVGTMTTGQYNLTIAKS